MKKMFRPAALLLALMVIATVFAGCAGGTVPAASGESAPVASGEAAPAASAATEAAPAAAGEQQFSIMIALWYPEPPQPDYPQWTKLEELVGAKLDIQLVPSDSYNDKLNVSIAAGQLPDAFCVHDNKANSYVTAARSGMFWEVGPAIAASANLSKNMPPEILANSAIDGKNYFIPRTRVTTRGAYVYRQDWLEQLGLEAPRNLEEYYEVLKAFATQDPTGTGNTTYGLITSQDDATGVKGLQMAATTMGAGNEWEEQDGALVPSFLTRTYMDAILWFKRLYDEKIINQDFATIKQEKGFELLNAELGGSYMGNSDEILNRFDALMSAKAVDNPDVALEDLFGFTSKMQNTDGGVTKDAGIGYYGGFTFPKTSLETEEEFQAIFSLFDRIDTDEVKNLTKWGIEGVNYEMRGDLAVAINPDRYTTEVQSFGQLNMTSATTPATLMGEEIFMRTFVEADQIDCQQYGVVNPVAPFISDTYTTKGLEIRKIYTDAAIQWVMGEIDEAGYLAAMEQWKEAGGNAIIQEYNDAWKAVQ